MSRAAPCDLRGSSAASRRPARGCPPGRGGWRRSGCPRSTARMFAADARLAGVRAQRLQVGGEHRGRCRAAPRRSSPRRRRRSSSRSRRSAIASTSMPSMPSVPLMSARPSFSAQLDRARAGVAQRLGRATRRAVGVADLALAHQRERAVGERREVARAAERAVLADDGRDAGGRAGRRTSRASRGRTPVRPVASVDRRSSISARTTSRSTSGPEPAACERIRLRCSCGAPLGRDVPGRERAEAGRDAVVRRASSRRARRRRRGLARDRRRAPRRSARRPAPCAGDARRRPRSRAGRGRRAPRRVVSSVRAMARIARRARPLRHRDSLAFCLDI